ncbi:hypothetical protein H4Q26_000854 [Puccinia striiformis f. sp. tritici PST-130]|nr:hypothetical protein H4Q26_000854 [Puccinia striiformis f. sp. tritici PST-130]
MINVVEIQLAAGPGSGFLHYLLFKIVSFYFLLESSSAIDKMRSHMLITPYLCSTFLLNSIGQAFPTPSPVNQEPEEIIYKVPDLNVPLPDESSIDGISRREQEDPLPMVPAPDTFALVHSTDSQKHQADHTNVEPMEKTCIVGEKRRNSFSNHQDWPKSKRVIVTGDSSTIPFGLQSEGERPMEDMEHAIHAQNRSDGRLDGSYRDVPQEDPKIYALTNMLQMYSAAERPFELIKKIKTEGRCHNTINGQITAMEVYLIPDSFDKLNNECAYPRDLEFNYRSSSILEILLKIAREKLFLLGDEYSRSLEQIIEPLNLNVGAVSISSTQRKIEYLDKLSKTVISSNLTQVPIPYGARGSGAQ